ncbi:MAG TPA: DbpA RNA binding domain-containing protein [Gemmatimonadales bacterium]
MTGFGEAPAALERGRPVMLVTPPAPAQAGALWALLPPPQAGRPAVIICADVDAAVEWTDAAPSGLRLHPVTGLARAARLLAAGAIDILAGTPADLAALAGRSALKLESVPAVVIAWPEGFASGEPAAPLDTLLTEMKDARRMVLSWNPASVDAFCERHARRPHVVGDLPVSDDARPLPPVGPARYVLAPRDRRAAAIRAALDALDPSRALVWRVGDPLPAAGAGTVICADLPGRAELSALSGAGDVVVLCAAGQLPYLRAIATPLRPLPVAGAVQDAADRAAALRARVAARLAQGDVDAELALLAPLFERFDAAEVAGALLAVLRDAAPGGPREAAAASAAVPQGWMKVFVNVGAKDRAAAKDLVGALIKEVGLEKTDIGRIEVKESFSLVDIAAASAERAVARLTGLTIRGRRVNAKLDR